VDHRPPAPAADAQAARWIAPRLIDQVGAVCATIPAGFEAYARILHPADPGKPAQVRWAELAAVHGRTMHPLAQFDRITTPAPGSSQLAPRRDVQPPMTGDLDPGSLQALCATLQAHSRDGVRCWFAVWDGWGELAGGRATVLLYSAADDPRPPAPRPPRPHWQLDLHAATFELPGRAYHLFTGPLEDARRLGWWPTADWFVPRSPNLFWPEDRRWCVACEIDFDSTLVAGPVSLIHGILHHDDLEAWPIDPHDSLTCNGDTINQP
jgi:hypothetical protein